MAFRAESQAKGDTGRYIIYRRESDDKGVTLNWPNKQLTSSETAIVRVQVALSGDEVEQTEEEIISRFKSVLISKTAETKMQHLITDFHIIAVEKGHGVVLYVHCISLNDLVQLREMQITGDLKTLIERMFGQLLSHLPFSEVTAENLKSVVESVFTQLLHRSQIPSLTVTLSEEDYQKCRLLFPGDIKLRAVVDFGPIQMSNREEIELGTCVQSKIRGGDAMLRHYERLWLNRSTMFYSLDTKPLVLSFEKGDKMETFSPANIGDNVGWWMVMHFKTGLIGFVPRNRVVIDFTSENQSVTNLYHLPLEILDIILQKFTLHWLLNWPIKQRNEEVIRSLISVDVCFYQRITRRWFKKAIRRFLKDFHGKTMKSFAIIRNNIKYLLENIKPNSELISSLLSLNCITLKESDIIQCQHCDRHKNDELLNAMRSFNGGRLANFMKCLRQTNQNTVARIIENGGDVMKIKVKTRGEKYAASMKAGILHENIEALQSRTKPWSQRTDELISQLRMEGIEILNSRLDRQTVAVWIWCHSQAALEYMQRMYESNHLRDIFSEFIEPSSSNMIKIDRNQFKKTVVVCPISINFTQRIDIIRNKRDGVRGVTKLRSEIYVLCASVPGEPSVILVFEDRNAFRPLKEINSKDMNHPLDIGSSEKENCLYVPDLGGMCVWKITRETADDFKIIKWLTTNNLPSSLSVSSDGQLLVVDPYSSSSSSLWIYGSDAKLIRSVKLPGDIKDIKHAVKTSIGNFIISHTCVKKKDGGEITEEKENGADDEEENDVEKNKEAKEKNGDGEEEGDKTEENKEVYETHDGENDGVEGIEKNDDEKEMEKKKEEEEGERGMCVISELTSDGQIVVRRFIPSNETQELILGLHLTLDSDEQVFVTYNDRILLLDSDLKLRRTLLSAEDEYFEMIPYANVLCYDDENKQLVVVRGTKAVYVYSVIRI